MDAVNAPHGGAPQHQYYGQPLMPAAKPPPRQRPHEVVVAVYLWIASLVIGLIVLATSFGSLGPQGRDELDAQLASNPELASMNPDTIVLDASIAVVVVSLVVVALRVFLLIKLAAGRRWARSILTVLGALSVLGAVVSVRSAGALDAALSVVNALLIAAAVVYMFSAGATKFFSPAPRG